MFTTTGEATILEDQPTQTPAAERPLRTVDVQPTMRRRGTALSWVGGGVAIAAAVASVLILSDEHTSVKADQTEGAGDHQATEVDVRGIPTWWTREGGARRSDYVAEPHARGIPTWSRQGGAPRSDDATELDVRGIPIWWSSEASAPGPVDSEYGRSCGS